MRGVNRATILGRVGKDPEVRATAAGQTVVGFSLAVSEKWKDKNTGQPMEKTEWLNCSAFGKTADIIAQYVRKGDPLYVEGKITTEKWQDKTTGADRYTTKIIVNQVELLGNNNGGQQPQQPMNNGFSGGNQSLPPHMQQPQPQQYQQPAQPQPQQYAQPQPMQQPAPQQQPMAPQGGQWEDDIPFN